MKACLFVLLLAVVFCSTDLATKIKELPDVVTCLLKSEVLRKVVLEVFQAVLAKDWNKILSIVLANWKAVYTAVKACLPA